VEKLNAGLQKDLTDKGMTFNATTPDSFRDKLRAAGLKPVTIWVPDVNAPGFKEQVAREIELINNSADEKAILEELAHVEIDGWK